MVELKRADADPAMVIVLAVPDSLDKKDWNI